MVLCTWVVYPVPSRLQGNGGYVIAIQTSIIGSIIECHTLFHLNFISRSAIQSVEVAEEAIYGVVVSKGCLRTGFQYIIGIIGTE